MPLNESKELIVFRAFAQACPAPIDVSTVRHPCPPRPDIECVVGRHLIGFEMVEIVDDGAAERLGSSLTIQRMLIEAYCALPEAKKALVRGRSLLVKFRENTSLHRRKETVPHILGAVATMRRDYEGMARLPQALAKAVQWLHVKPANIPHILASVSSFGHYGDPVVERVQRKLQKQYDFDGPLELVAYYETQGSLAIEFNRDKLAATLMKQLGSARFRRVWVYGRHEHAILFVSPPWGAPGFSPLVRDL